MVENGVGITLLPVMTAESERLDDRRLTILPFVKPQPSRTVALAWRRSSPHQESYHAFGEVLATAGRDVQAPPRRSGCAKQSLTGGRVVDDPPLHSNLPRSPGVISPAQNETVDRPGTDDIASYAQEAKQAMPETGMDLKRAIATLRT